MTGGLTLTEVRVSFGNHAALQDVTLEIPSEGCVALVGPNGAGKSTLLDLLSGFIGLSDGRIETTNGRRLTRHRLGEMSVRLHQRLLIPTALRVAEFLGMAAEPKGDLRFWAKRRPCSSSSNQVAHRILNSAGIGDPDAVRIGELSWGQQRVVAIVATLIAPKRLLLLDEPFAGLSPVVRSNLVEVLADQAARRPVVIAEHELDLVEQLADRTIVFSQGHLREDLSGTGFYRAGIMKLFGVAEHESADRV
jgi:ABC-type branched-subunit amino acid transport system ATPase component